MTIEEIIKARNKMTSEAYDARAAVQEKFSTQEARERYTDEYIKKTIRAEFDKNLAEEHEANIAFNKMLVNEVTRIANAEKESAYPPFNKPGDYAVQIANALTLLQTLPLSEENVELVLKPFSADYEQMLIFEKLVESMEQNAQKAEGREPCRYEQIFGLARRTTERLNECNEIVSLAKELFLYPKAEFGFSPFELSIEDGYMERAGQAKMLEFAEQLYQKEVLE